MHRVSVQEAQSRLAELVTEAVKGEAVVIAQDDGSAVQLMPIADSLPQPRFGSAKGRVKVADDFDDPLEDFAEYMS